MFLLGSKHDTIRKLGGRKLAWITLSDRLDSCKLGKENMLSLQTLLRLLGASIAFYFHTFSSCLAEIHSLLVELFVMTKIVNERSKVVFPWQGVIERGQFSTLSCFLFGLRLPSCKWKDLFQHRHLATFRIIYALLNVLFLLRLSSSSPLPPTHFLLESIQREISTGGDPQEPLFSLLMFF